MGACLSREAQPAPALRAAAAAAAAPADGAKTTLALGSTHVSAAAAYSPGPPLAACGKAPGPAGVLPSCGGVAPDAGGTPALLQAADEEGRMHAVHELNSHGMEPRPQFDQVTMLMKKLFDTPVAAVTLIAEELQFVSRAGNWACSAGRAGSFCDWALVPDAHQMLVVEDASTDPRFKDNLYVLGEPHIRFYAGTPLVSTKGGHRYGTLCVFDFKPRSFSAAQYAMLAHFGEIVTREVEREMMLAWQRAELTRVQVHSHLTRAMDCFHEGIILLDMSAHSWAILYANDSFRDAAGMPHLLAGAAAPPLGSQPAAGSQAAGGAGAGSGRIGGGGGGGGDVTEKGEAAAQRVDFWELFGHVTSGTQDSCNSALLARACGREFTIRVRPASTQPTAATATSADADGAGSCSPGRQPELTILFRPADSDQLCSAMPHVGIPAWVGLGMGSERAAGTERTAGSEQAAGDVATAPAHATAAGTAIGNAGGGGVGNGQEEQQQQQGHTALVSTTPQAAPSYYFGIVQEELGSDEETSSPAPSVSPSCGLCSPAKASGHTSTTAETATDGEPSPSIAEMDASSMFIPSFFQMRPEVLSEVSLGPLIGTGSCGRCFRAMWQGGRVCVKVIDCYFLTHQEGAAPGRSLGDSSTAPMGPQAAVLEALLARSLSHPHIVSTFCHGVSTEEIPDQGKTHQQVWIVQEFCNRGALLDAIDRGVLQLPNGRPNLPAILAAAQEMAGAITYLHSHKIIHGDMTPNNVLMTSGTKDARRWVCKVADFGLSVLLQGDDMKRSAFVGTVTHMPPELLTSGILTKSCDVYSFGIIVLEMWYSRRAWLGTNPMRIVAQASAGELPFTIPTDMPLPLADLLRRCLDLEPTLRPPFPEILSQIQALARTLTSLKTRTSTCANAGIGTAPAGSRSRSNSGAGAGLGIGIAPAGSIGSVLRGGGGGGGMQRVGSAAAAALPAATAPAVSAAKAAMAAAAAAARRAPPASTAAAAAARKASPAAIAAAEAAGAAAGAAAAAAAEAEAPPPAEAGGAPLVCIPWVVARAPSGLLSPFAAISAPASQASGST